MDLDTFVTTVYVMLDDYCKAQQVSWPKSPGPAPSLPVSEVLTWYCSVAGANLALIGRFTDLRIGIREQLFRVCRITASSIA